MEGNVYANVDYFSSKSFYYPLLSNIVYHNTFNLQELGESVLVNSYMGSDRTKYTDTLADTDVTYYNVLRNGDKVYSSETDAGLNVDHLFDNDSNVSGDVWSTAWYDSDGKQFGGYLRVLARTQEYHQDVLQAVARYPNRVHRCGEYLLP